MKKKSQAFIAIILFITSIIPAFADSTHPRGINLDGTIGNAGNLSLPGPDYDIKAEYGHQAGANLFHSFGQFSIHSDESATFTGPNSVRNIITRVTGGNASWIDGKLRSEIPNADLYMLNPAGMMFGPNASLDISGSFHVSTGDYLRMGENEKFYAVPQESDVLSVSDPTAFGFLDNNVAPITFEGQGEITGQEWNDNPTGLSVSEGKTISLIGGNIEIKNGVSVRTLKTDDQGNPVFEQAADENGNPMTDDQGNPMPVPDENGNPIQATETESPGDIRAPGGRINIAGVASAGEVILTEAGLNVTSSEKGNITLSGKISLNADGEGGGSIFIRGGEFVARDSDLQSRTLGNKNGRVIDIQADTVSLSAGASISGTSVGQDKGAGKGGNVDIEARQINLTNGAVIVSGTTGPGESGTLVIKVADTLTASDSLILGTSIGQEEGAGNGGSVDIEARQINLTGEGGIVKVEVEGQQINLAGAAIDSSTFGPGEGGSVDIEAQQLSLTSAQISSVTLGPGKGSTLVIKVADVLNASDDSRILGSSFGQDKEAGKGGRVEIEARQINLTRGAVIDSSTFGPGKGGTLVIKVADVLNASDDSRISGTSSGQEEGAGKGGSVEIEARQINLTRGALITSGTSGPGEGGTLVMKVADVLNASGGRINGTSSGQEEGAGKGGSVEIEARQINLTHSLITSGTLGPGEGGSVEIEARQINLTSSQISSGTLGPGEGGSVGIEARQINLTGALIDSSTNGLGKGGSVDIEAQQINLTRSQISSGTNGPGKSSTLIIKADVLDASDTSRILGTSSGQEEGAGKGGSVEIEARQINLTSGAVIDSSTLGPGEGGSVEIEARQINLTDGAQITSGTTGPGKGGTIVIKVADVLNASGTNEQSGDGSGVYGNSISQDQGAGKGGSVEIEAREINLTDGAQISSATSGPGEGGTLVIKVADALNASDSAVTASTLSQEEGAGKGGSLEIEARQINLTGEGWSVEIQEGEHMDLPSALIDSSTLGPGEGGSLVIKSAVLTASGGLIWGRSLGSGNAGTILVSAPKIILRNNGEIATSGNGSGKAGNIALEVSQLQLDSNAKISSESTSGEEYAGAAGKIVIAGKIRLGRDDHGNIAEIIEPLEPADSLSMQNNSSVRTDARNAGGGEITIDIRKSLHLSESEISTDVMEDDTAGDITIGNPGTKTGPGFVMLNHSRIHADAEGKEGYGGAVFIFTDNYVKAADSSVTASSEKRGNEGTVEIAAPDLDISSGLFLLPASYLDAAQWMKAPCALRSAEKVSRFVFTGIDGVPAPHDDLLASPLFMSDSMETSGNEDDGN